LSELIDEPRATADTAGNTTTDSLDFARVTHIFLRTWPFIRPSAHHLLYFLLLSGVAFLVTAALGLLIIGLLMGGIVGGEPLGRLHALLYGLDPAVYVDVDELSDEARLQLPWLVIWTATPLLAIVIVSGVALYYYSVWIFQQINQRMRIKLIDQLQMQSLAFHARAKTGDAIYRLYQDSAMVTSIIQHIFLEPLMYVGRYLFGVAVVFAFSPRLALILGLTLGPVLYIGYRFSSPLRRAFRAAREANSRLTAWIQESVAGMPIIKATTSESARTRDFETHSRGAFDTAFRARFMLATLGVLAFVIVGIAILIAQSLAAVFAHEGAPTFARDLLLGFGFAAWNLGTFSAATSRASDGVTALEALLSVWGRAQDMAVGLNRVFDILDLEPEVEDRVDARALGSFSPRVCFENVSFGYSPGLRVLHDIDLTAEPGTVTALVGPTGAGKSTLMSLLLRLADPDTGRITIDGQPITDIRLDSLRDNIAIATQENLLFTGSVLENLSYARPSATREEVAAAARVACADEFIERLPQGYDTPLGQRATKLSTGQRQRLVIARALVKDTPILILDEPTAALDVETELTVMQNLLAWRRQRCVFLITHRLSSARNADQVVYMREGRIMARGPHDVLLRESTAYRAFVASEAVESGNALAEGEAMR